MRRLFASLMIGLIVTLALFWLMQAMVMNNQRSFKKTDDLRMVEFVRLKRETHPKPQEHRTQKRPPPPEKQPPTPKISSQPIPVQAVAQPDLNIPKLDIPLPAARFSGSVVAGLKAAPGHGPAAPDLSQGESGISTNIIPLVRIPPRYPMRAANRHIEGQVTVEFTITKTGQVSDAVVVDAQPSNIFNRAALDAIRKWKFKPKVVAGQPVEQRARQILQFKLSR